MTLGWKIDGVLAERGGASTYALEVQNNEDAEVDTEIVLQLDGLGVHRTRSLGKIVLAARERRVLSWAPASSPIVPWGTLARVTAEARYTRDGFTQRIPARLLFLSFSRDGARAFASDEDGELVRLASLGRRTSPWNKGAVSAAERDAQLAQLGGRRGKLDGVPLDESPADVLTRKARRLASKAAVSADGNVGTGALVEDEEDIGDSMSREGDLATPSAGGAAAQSFIIPPVDPGPLPYCPGATYPVTTPTCISLRPTGYRDLGVGAPTNVPAEDAVLTNYPAAYANAAIYESGALRWSGRLNASGCTPAAVRYCPQNARIEVSTSSFERWAQFDGIYYSLSRQLRLTPARTFIAQVVIASSPTTGMPIGAANVHASTVADQHVLRVASVLARLLRMGDDGLGNGSAPPLNLHTETGCCNFPEFHYALPSGQILCGEACADANDAFFGQNLAVDPNTGTLRPTSVHSTQDAYVVGHELGHSVQMAAAGGPGSGGFADIGLGNCSCDHVRDGNRKHCLQSRHNVKSAQAEGFAHFFATRIMNNKDSDARFTYYKDVRRFATFYVNGVPVPAPYGVAPPVPINTGMPAYDSFYGQTTGWVRKFCPAADVSSEYDWLTFLWAINGKVNTANLSLSEIFAILGSVSGSFTWPNIRARAQTNLALGSAKFNRFDQQAGTNGTNL
ncbi:MAG: hypothetical protein KF795_18905 [Labilithrix sp.]|nr:hypothetical protein [Labilithrix sp.]